MTREIEFRGQLKSNGSWVYGDLIHDNRGACYIFPIDSMCLSLENKVDQNTIGEFTGMRDKNGKKIYEGDVVDMRPRYSQPHRIEYSCGQWICVDGCGGWVTLTEDEQLGDETNGVGVIGNIYDNPELLDKK